MIRENHGIQVGGVAGCGRRHTNKGKKMEQRVIFEGLRYFSSLQFTQFGKGAINWQLWMMADNVSSVLLFVSILAYA